MGITTSSAPILVMQRWKVLMIEFGRRLRFNHLTQFDSNPDEIVPSRSSKMEFQILWIWGKLSFNLRFRSKTLSLGVGGGALLAF